MLDERTRLFALGMNRRGDRACVSVALRCKVRYSKLRIAAAIGKLHLDRSALVQNAVVQRKRAVTYTISNAGKTVVDALELLAVQNFLLRRSRGTVIFPAKPVCTKQEKEKNNDPPSAAATSLPPQRAHGHFAGPGRKVS